MKAKRYLKLLEKNMYETGTVFMLNAAFSVDDYGILVFTAWYDFRVNRSEAMLWFVDVMFVQNANRQTTLDV